MAHVKTIQCEKCKQPKTVMVGGEQETPSICNDCKSKQAEDEKREHLETRAKLSPEERLAKSEEEIYDLLNSPHHLMNPRF